MIIKLTLMPGQGEGWGGGRNQASAMPAFDPHPTLPPARGKEQLSLVTYLTTFRASRVSLHHARGQGLGMPSQPGPATLAICDQPLDPQCNLPKILRRINHFNGVVGKASFCDLELQHAPRAEFDFNCIDKCQTCCTIKKVAVMSNGVSLDLSTFDVVVVLPGNRRPRGLHLYA